MGKKLNRDEIIVSCPKCGYQHFYKSLNELEQTSIFTPCKNCGFLFLQYIFNKMKATQSLLESDPQAVALLKAGDIKGFKSYLKKKTGLF